MSMLLEALRKSEEQRQVGKAPDIHSPDGHRSSAVSGGGAPWVPVALMAVAAVVMTYLVWDQYRLPEGMASAPAVQDMISPSPGLAERTETPSREPDGTATQERQASPVETFRAAPDSGESADSVEDARRQALASSYESYTAPPGEQTEDPTTVPEQSTAPALRPMPAPEPPSRGAGNAPAQTGQAASPGLGIVSYWEVPQNVRDSMPEFNITVMVYAEQPQDRFLLMNGRRLAEDDEIDGVRLETIRRDGAIFRFRTYRFLVEG